MKKLLIFLLTLSSTLFATPKQEFVQRGLKAAVKITIGDGATGSGYGIMNVGNKTLIVTNDHVCQTSRGYIFDMHQVMMWNRLNFVSIYVEDVAKRQYRAYVVKASNKTLSITSKPDLCLLEVNKKLPIVEIGDEPLLGSEIFSISAPRGFFPMIHTGYRGPEEFPSKDNGYYATTLSVTFGSSGGPVFSSDNGKLVGTIFAIVPAETSEDITIAALVIPIKKVVKFLNQYLSEQKLR